MKKINKSYQYLFVFIAAVTLNLANQLMGIPEGNEVRENIILIRHYGKFIILFEN